MQPGLREHHSATLRVCVPEALPDEMKPLTRELIDLQAGNQRKGHGTALMWTVCAEADKWWITLIVQPRKFADGMDDAKLIPWYEKFGFVQIQPTEEEPDLSVLMVRSPELPKIQRVH